MDWLTDWKADLRKFEGWIPWIYLDSKGNVTVGCGHLVRTFAEGLDLPFTPRLSLDEFTRVKAMLPNMLARVYASASQARLSDEAIDQILDADIQPTLKELQNRFPAFSGWPAGPQQATADMGFNLGVAGLETHFPRLTVAIEKQDWSAAAEECHRQDVSDYRNQKTAALLRIALPA